MADKHIVNGPDWFDTEGRQIAAHEGGDDFERLDFIDAARGKCPPVIGIHEAMDVALPGLISQQSIQRDGAWLPVPDSREW